MPKIEKGTVGEALFSFACSIRNVTPVLKDPEPRKN